MLCSPAESVRREDTEVPPDQREVACNDCDLDWKSRRNDRRRQTYGDALPCADTLDAAKTHGRSDVEPPLESPAEEVTRLRDSLNDLRGIMALPALWTGGEPPRIVSTSLDALLGIANELEERVAQRTRELAIANEALRESERNSRLVVDSIPGLVALLTAAGEVEFVNRQILEYTGQTLEELKQWGTNDTVHPEDLPHVIQVFTQSIGSGSSIRDCAATPAVGRRLSLVPEQRLSASRCKRPHRSLVRAADGHRRAEARRGRAARKRTRVAPDRGQHSRIHRGLYARR